MATVRISQLTAITTPTDDDILIINDADTNTRKITFANLTQGLLNTGATAQTKSGNLTISGIFTANGNVVLGDSATDTVTITGVVDSDVIPDAGTEDLGSATNRWAEIHAAQYLTDTTITAAGTTGAQTINKIAGSVNFAAAATSLVVTCDKVTANSVVIATVATNDATMTSVQAVAAAGSFTLHANAAATAETRVNFVAIN
jgi:hypothetical protein